ncbi:MAG: ROK family protein [Candidatus Lokiarchaeota archaeon]|nr:ROK family protein [Candidatus Lokiarchaeota archaeon]MBD3201784.1 ROK family protein [Candidatus Lokiarchaeota archaeon]
MVDEYIGASDIGGTWVRVALSNINLEEGEILSKKERTKKENIYSISKQVCMLLNDLLNEHSLEASQLIGIGLASAGPINIREGIVFNNANLGFREIPLKKPIIEEFPDIPFYLINDCNAAVLGIHFFEANKKEKDNLVYITMSTGIGGGAICNGLLLLGKDGNAAEIGHAKVVPNSKHQCNCEAYGCWEAYSSGTAVKKRTLSFLGEGELNGDILLELVDNNKSEITAKEVFEAARLEDELSQKVVSDCVFYSKVGVGLINNFYDCDTIFFGGAMMNDEDQIIPPLREQFRKDAIKFTINHPPELKLTEYRDEIGLRGALTLVKYKLENSEVVKSYNF